MKISKLIEELQKVKELHGDILTYRYFGDHIGEHFPVEKIKLMYKIEDNNSLYNSVYGIEVI